MCWEPVEELKANYETEWGKESTACIAFHAVENTV
jgi:hypothetical protein